jgi:hypothetical protein
MTNATNGYWMRRVTPTANGEVKVALPTEFTKLLNLKAGSILALRIKDHTLIVSPMTGTILKEIGPEKN